MKHRYPLMLFLFFALISAKSIAQSSLNSGDIAITTYNTNGNQSFSFITFVNIQKNTKIYFTDRGWDTTTNAFGTAPEGIITWTATSSIPALTEIIIENPKSNIGTSTGVVSKSGNFNITAIGDQILVYQESNTTIPNFIYAFNRGRAILDHASGLRTSSTLTMLPEGLTLNIDIFSSTSSKKNWQYRCTGPREGNKESLLSLFMPSNNYNTSSDSTYLNGALSQNGCSFTLNNADFTKPVINAQTFGLREDAPNGHSVGVPAVDDGSNTQFKNWRIVGGSDQNKFEINNNTGMITVKNRSTFDFENIDTRSYYIYIEVDDLSGNSSESSTTTDQGKITINIEDYVSSITASSSPEKVLEGNTGVFTFTISEPSYSATTLNIVNYTGFATPGIDYTQGPSTITIPANQSSVDINIETIIDSDTEEIDETVFIVALLAETSNDITLNGVAQFTIENFNTSLSIADSQLSKELKLYPNPSTGTLYLTADTKNNLQYLELFTLRGKLINTIPLNSLERQRIDLNALTNGTYILKIYGENAVAVKKLTLINK